MREPLISCLCVTENRPAFMPWLLWNYERQTWSRRELIIVDSSATPFVHNRPDVHVLAVPPGAGVAAKRNLALHNAQGDLITWFDDDDWQHPEKLALLAAALQDKAVFYAGGLYGWFVDLATRRCVRHHSAGRYPIFNSAGFRRSAILPLRFAENLRRAADTRWLRALARRYPAGVTLLDREDLFFWLCHDANLSNPAHRRRFSHPIETLRQIIGETGWGDTGQALAELHQRLSGVRTFPTASTLKKATLPAEPVQIAPFLLETTARSTVQDEAGSQIADPAVSVMIKATVLDVPYLDVMVRHMIAQARYPFAERTVVVERQVAFSGKFRSRPRATPVELDAVLERLLADRVIDSVREVDTRPAVREQIMQRYFGDAARRVPTHDITGAPIYATLFGIESMATDLVLQMDADVFFYTGSESWVREALRCREHDSRLWLMMTHPGPPGGPMGRSLGPANTRRAVWDADLRIWRFRHATSRYFLCDRRQLYGLLRPVFWSGGCAPLEHCLSAALQRHSAYRACLGNLQSWHLHAWYHGTPFPDWAPALAQSIAAGHYPNSQAGEYDLRLDRPASRRAWQGVLFQPDAQVTTQPKVVPSEIQPAATPPSAKTLRTKHSSFARDRSTEGHVAPLAVIIPIRDRAKEWVRNALFSLQWQSAGAPSQVILVSHGSRPGIDHELGELAAATGAMLLCTGSSDQPWNKSLALNTGIRATHAELPYLMTMDADMILAPNFFEVVLERLHRVPPALVLCRISDLPQRVTLPGYREELYQLFHHLHALTVLRGRHGSGGIQAAHRSFFFDIRGYDEDFLWWGAMDNDLVNRARLVGLDVEWIEDRTAMLHQWHLRKHNILTDPREISQARMYWRRNHEIIQIRAKIAHRNPGGWGGMAE